jgi:hypothetical protein
MTRSPGLLLALALFAQGPAALADIKVDRTDDNERFAIIEITGDITKYDALDFPLLVKSLQASFDVVKLELNSHGGDATAALEIGEIVRKERVWTVVTEDPATECLSACVLVFAAGAVRIAGDGSRVGIHRPRVNPQNSATLGHTQERSKYTALTRKIRAYLKRMGVADELFQMMMQISSRHIRWLRYKEMEAMNLVGKDPAYEEGMRTKDVVR